MKDIKKTKGIKVKSDAEKILDILDTLDIPNNLDILDVLDALKWLIS